MYCLSVQLISTKNQNYYYEFIQQISHFPSADFQSTKLEQDVKICNIY